MRRKDREVTDMNEISRILKEAKLLHLAMIDGSIPYVVPMNYGYTLESGRLTLYLHSAPEGRKLDVLRAAQQVAFSMECDVVPVAGKSACNYGTNYASLMGTGKAEFLTDPEDKKAALAALMLTQTGKSFQFDDRMAMGVAVLRISVEEYTAKKRAVPDET